MITAMITTGERALGKRALGRLGLVCIDTLALVNAIFQGLERRIPMLICPH